MHSHPHFWERFLPLVIAFREFLYDIRRVVTLGCYGYRFLLSLF